MRLLQVQVGPSQVLDLHPRLSVVRRLSDRQRRALLEAVGALAEGRRGPSPGLLEAFGVLFPLDSGVLESLPHPGAGPDRIVGPSDSSPPVGPTARSAVGGATAAERLHRARLALDRAEEEAQEAQPDRDEVDKLEAIHGRLLGARGRSSARIGRTKARQRVEELEAAEAAQLDVLGFPSYADYVAGTGLPTAGTEAEARVDAARLELLEAEAALREAERQETGRADRSPSRPGRRSRPGDVLVRVREAAAAASVAGRLPVVVVGVLEGLSVAEADRVLSELDEVAGRSQVILLADEPHAAAWAAAAGVGRAAVVHPDGP